MSSLFSAVLIIAAAAAAAASPMMIGKPGCNTTCGDVSVPYPFGMGPARCYHSPGFNLTCDTSRRRQVPRLLFGDGDTQFEIVDIFVENNTVRAISDIHAVNISTSGGQVRWGLSEDVGGPFSVAPWNDNLPGNDFILTGCNVEATLVGGNTATNMTTIVSACSSSCNGSPIDGGGGDQYGDTVCTGNGCCKASIGYVWPSYDVLLKRLDDHQLMVPLYVFIAEYGWFGEQQAMDLLHGSAGTKPPELAVPVIFSWALPYAAARDILINSTLRSCSDDYDGNKGDGFYQCYCNDGYYGNPYLTGGCQDFNECESPKDYGCFGECSNTDGSFHCRCPLGFHGDPSLPNGCANTGFIIGLSAASGPSFVLLVLAGWLIHRKIKHHRAERLKQKFFDQNRGKILQQLVSERSDIAERMIIPLKELEKATNKFDPTRKLGGGGHGTVFKGILSDLHVVAIKKSNIVVQKEIDEFINEVAILSQINHRNIVKLHGCCLETEVPLLAYEFISNGTLSDHLHRESPRSIPWGDRLRIASEVGKAIAYLHSAVSVSIIHRDIKSANILLDDAFTAKVSDFGASRHIATRQREATSTDVQGTIGYLDPKYWITGRLSEKSDVYSFGILLVELLTRKMPFTYSTSENLGLGQQFVALLEEDKLVELLDPQVIEEGGSEVNEIAALAATCIKWKEEERPTMRQVEVALEGFQATKEGVPGESSGLQEASRRYSLEVEFELSATYPR